MQKAEVPVRSWAMTDFTIEEHANTPTPRPTVVNFFCPLRPPCTREGAEDEQGGGDADTGVGNVERWPCVLLDVEMEKIGHGTVQDAVGQIAEDAAREEAERDPCETIQVMLALPCSGIADQEEDDYCKSDRCEPNEKHVVPSKHAERSAGIRRVDEAEESGNNRDFAAVGNVLTHQPLC